MSDGVLAPIELIRRAIKIGYRVMAITDHVGHGNLEYVLKTLIKDCRVASDRWDILALPGVEITHTLTSAFCGFADIIAEDIRQAGYVEGIEDVKIVTTFDPPFTMDSVSEETRMIMGW